MSTPSEPAIKGQVHTDFLHRVLYATDASVYREVPEGVFIPMDSEDLHQIVNWGIANGKSLIPRTAGTSLAGQCVGGSWVVDTGVHMNQILDFDPENRTVRVQPGVVRDELNRFLKPHGLWFSPNTSTSNRCMIGGMVGNNSSGSTSIKYGVTRDKVKSIKGIAGDGSWINLGPHEDSTALLNSENNGFEAVQFRVLYNELSDEAVQERIRKNYPDYSIHRRNNGYAIDELIRHKPFHSTGDSFNFSRLVCGSEGTLMLMSEIELHLDELPQPFAALICPHFTSINDAMLAVEPVMQIAPEACELMDKVVLDCTKSNRQQAKNRFFIEGDPEAVLMIEVRGATEQELRAEVEKLTAVLSQTNATSSPVLKGDEITAAWELRKAGLGVLSNVKGDKKPVACIEDTAVKISDLPNYIAEFQELMESFDQRAVYYAHAGAGELHLRPILNLKLKSEVEQFRLISEASARLVRKYNGSLAGEHGVGRVRAPFLEEQVGEENYKFLQRIKDSWDPHGVFNPGKIVRAKPMDEDLRFVPDRAEPSPETYMNFDDDGGILRHAERCNGTALCRKSPLEGGVMCPSFHATGLEKDNTRGRANALREWYTHGSLQGENSDWVAETLDLCLSCKACQSECPSNVDMAKLKAEFQYAYYQSHKRPLRDYLFGRFALNMRRGSLFPELTNILLGENTLATWFKRRVGITTRRALPKLAAKTFRDWWKRHKPKRGGDALVLYVDEFINYNEPEIGIKAVLFFEKLGFRVMVPYYGPSGRSELSKGYLKEARKHADWNVEFLREYVDQGVPIVGLEPSAILSFRDEYPDLVSDKWKTDARALADNCYLFEEFVWRGFEEGVVQTHHFHDVKRSLVLHAHCHQKAIADPGVSAHVLSIPVNYHVEHVPSGCCGMAGAFGYEEEHYEVSMKIADQTLFPHLKNQPDEKVLVANGTSCRSQIADGLQKKSFHPVEILYDALSDGVG